MTNAHLGAHLGRATLSNSGWYLNQLITFLTIGDDTGGQFSLLRIHCGEASGQQPAHIHTREDETIYLLEGEVTITASGEELRMRPGDTVTIPRGIAHTMRHDTAGAQYLLQFSPAGFEGYFYEMSAPAEYLGPPERPLPADAARMRATAARFGCAFTEPPP